MAAASLGDAMRELGEVWGGRGHPVPRFAFAASSALARQIEQGAPADIFVSADERWADYLEGRGLLVSGSRVGLLGNSLVLIAPADRAGKLEMGPGVDLLSWLGADGRMAVGDPAGVPAGAYAKASLMALGVWAQMEPRLAKAENVRAALLLVERGEAALGIVYATDALASKKVRVVGVFPDGSHPTISYPFALVKGGDTPRARALLAFLTGAEAAPIYRRLGFTVRE